MNRTANFPGVPPQGITWSASSAHFHSTREKAQYAAPLHGDCREVKSVAEMTSIAYYKPRDNAPPEEIEGIYSGENFIAQINGVLRSIPGSHVCPTRELAGQLPAYSTGVASTSAATARQVEALMKNQDKRESASGNPGRARFPTTSLTLDDPASQARIAWRERLTSVRTFGSQISLRNALKPPFQDGNGHLSICYPFSLNTLAYTDPKLADIILGNSQAGELGVAALTALAQMSISGMPLDMDKKDKIAGFSFFHQQRKYRVEFRYVVEKETPYSEQLRFETMRISQDENLCAWFGVGKDALHESANRVPHVSRSFEHVLVPRKKNDTPHGAVHSSYMDSAWPCERDRERAEEAQYPRRTRLIDKYDLHKAADAHSSGPPADRTPYRGPDAVPNIMHWEWARPECAQEDLFKMLDFAARHPDHDLNFWTDDREAIIAALDKFAAGHPAGQDMAAIANFKKRLKIQSVYTLCENNGLTDRENEELKMILLREKNAMFRHYGQFSDYIRVLVLFKYGGLYMDVDTLIAHFGRNNVAKDLRAPKGILVLANDINAMAATAGALILREALRTLIGYYKYGSGYLNKLLDDGRRQHHSWHTVNAGDATWVAKRKPPSTPPSEKTEFSSPTNRFGLTLILLNSILGMTDKRKVDLRREGFLFDFEVDSGGVSGKSWHGVPVEARKRKESAPQMAPPESPEFVFRDDNDDCRIPD